MERTLSQEERQKRAEELYYRRQNLGNRVRTTTVNINPRKNYKLLKKVLIQIIICMVLYGLIYQLAKNTDKFSIDSINYLKSTMAYDININQAFDNIKQYMTKFNLQGQETMNGEETVANEVKEDTLSASDQTEENTPQSDENANDAAVEEDASSVSEIQENSEYIKSNFSMIKPVTGPVTSRFGLRNPTTPTVPKYHTGIDIGVPEGTIFVAAMEGTVEVVSSQGDYRKSCKNYKWRCSYSLCTL